MSSSAGSSRAVPSSAAIVRQANPNVITPFAKPQGRATRSHPNNVLYGLFGIYRNQTFVGLSPHQFVQRRWIGFGWLIEFGDPISYS